MRHTTSLMLALWAALLLLLGTAGGCGSDDDGSAGGTATGSQPNHCNPDDPSYDPEGCACDPTDASGCPADYVCRPSGNSSVCESEGTAGRIPSWLDPDGIDVFAAEANGALSVTWKVNGDIDFSGGFEVRYGIATGDYQDSVTVGPADRQVILRPLDNGVTHYVAVDALGSGSSSTFTSCEVDAVPHFLAFQSDVRVNDDTGGDQTDPDLASNFEGSRLYLAWESQGAIALALSTNFGDAWIETEVVADNSQNPAVAIRSEVRDDQDALVTDEAAYIVWEQGGELQLRPYAPVTGSFAAPMVVASGSNPDMALGPDSIHIVYEDGGAVYHTVSSDEGQSFATPQQVSGALVEAAAPSVAVDGLSGDVFVAWHGREGAGDFNVYIASSGDSGTSFGGAVRVDDDPLGQNQTNMSVAVDVQTGLLYATWEDRRGGANVYFASSDDSGASWATNIDVGAGLGGDQFRPQAVIDVASNVYVAFHDTTDGQKVVFSRFNDEGTFDPPLAPSSQAGAGGVVGDNPTVATDRYGAVYVAWQENRNGPNQDIFFAWAE